MGKERAGAGKGRWGKGREDERKVADNMETKLESLMLLV